MRPSLALSLSGFLCLTSCQFFNGCEPAPPEPVATAIAQQPPEVMNRAREALSAFKNEDSGTLKALTHPQKGVRFSPYAFVDVKSDVHLNAGEMGNFFSTTKEYLWGLADGTGEPLRMTPAAYNKKFIYSSDFLNADQVNLDKVEGRGNSLENQSKIYPNARIVEFYISGKDPAAAGMDWESLRLAFEQHQGQWFLVGVIHNQWTT